MPVWGRSNPFRAVIRARRATAPVVVTDFRSSSQLLGADRTSIPVPVPPGAAVDDIAVVGLFVQSTNVVTPPAGFTVKYDSGVLNAIRLVVYWKRLTAADSGTWIFTTPSTQWTRAVAGLWAGRITTGDPFSAASGVIAASGQASITVPGVTALVGDDLVGIATSFNDASFTPPSGMTERQDPTEGITLASQDDLVAGATGDKTFTANSSSGIAGWIGALGDVTAPATPPAFEGWGPIPI